MVRGFKPALEASQLYVAVAILGATVMPHNLYLHSALVKTRKVAHHPLARDTAMRTSLMNTVVALNLAQRWACRFDASFPGIAQLCA